MTQTQETDLKKPSMRYIAPARRSCLSRTQVLVLAQWMRAIEFQVQFEHIDTGLPQDPELPVLREFLNESPHFGFTDVSFSRHSGDLELSRSGRNLGIEPRTRSGHQVHGDRRRRVFRLGFLYIGFHAVDQRLVRRAEIRATARSRIVSGSGRGRPRMKINRLREGLPDDPRAHDLAVFLE